MQWSLMVSRITDVIKIVVKMVNYWMKKKRLNRLRVAGIVVVFLYEYDFYYY